MNARRGPVRALTAVMVVASCATISQRGAGSGSDEALTGWKALAEGRRPDAQATFDRRLRAAPRDPIALFGRASVDYERGASDAAADGYVAALTALAEAPDAASGYGPLLAPVAANRVLTLYDEVGATARRRIIDRLAPATRARDADLPWLARVELVRLATHAAREAGDATELARVARTSGCVTVAADLGLIGPLASADLTAPAPASSRAPRSGRAVSGPPSRRTAEGCA